MIRVTNEYDGVALGIVEARGVVVEASPDSLVQKINSKIKEIDDISQDLKKSVRDMLRLYGFKPSGRNKPASEYLYQAAQKGTFPFINNLVDINNLVSLETALPISLLDLDVLGENILVRPGREGEEYIFNRSGQVLSLKGLIVVCKSDNDMPLGTPIKDSMAGKITTDSKNVLYVVYGPKDRKDLLYTATSLLQEYLSTWVKSASTSVYYA